MTRFHRLPLALSLAAGCTGEPTKSLGDSGPDTTPAPSCPVETAVDLDPADDVVDVELVASAFAWDAGTGALIDGLAYNGRVPGPVIDVRKGDTLRVRFRNDMDSATTIHWHGLRVPEAMDGVSQMEDPVEPGESFTYEFVVQDVGFYWYHPHMATDLALERGLYGAIVARDVGEDPAPCDVPVVLDDVLLDGSGQIAEASMMDTMGRLGDVLLANGRSDGRLAVTAGETLLLRLVNAANARYFRLSLPGHSLEVVGTDGGWLAEPEGVDELVVAPGERYLVRVELTGTPGSEYAFENRRYVLHADDATMSETDPLGNGPNPVLVLAYGDGTADHAWAPPAVVAPDLAAGEVLHHWVLDEAGMHTNTIDGETWPDVPVVEAPADTVTTFEVENRTDMHHPMHIHGQRFQVMALDDEPVRAAWKDTVDIPPGATVRLASELDNPGDWLYHCHILEHAEDGMAGLLQVR